MSYYGPLQKSSQSSEEPLGSLYQRNFHGLVVSGSVQWEWRQATMKNILGRVVESVLNNQPLTCLSDDIKDPQPLTPSHVLHGRTLTILPHHLVAPEDLQNPWEHKATKIQSYRYNKGHINEHYRKSGYRYQGGRHSSAQWRIYWKPAAVEKLAAVVEEHIVGGDGFV